MTSRCCCFLRLLLLVCGGSIGITHHDAGFGVRVAAFLPSGGLSCVFRQGYFLNASTKCNTKENDGSRCRWRHAPDDRHYYRYQNLGLSLSGVGQEKEITLTDTGTEANVNANEEDNVNVGLVDEDAGTTETTSTSDDNQQSRNSLVQDDEAGSTDGSVSEEHLVSPPVSNTNSSITTITPTCDYYMRFAGVGRLYARQIALTLVPDQDGEEQEQDPVIVALERLSKATVMIIGLGGVGSWAAEALCRSGVGNLVLVDLDDVCISNVNRQLHATSQTVGQFKISAMKERLMQINPTCNVTTVFDFVSTYSHNILCWTDSIIVYCIALWLYIYMRQGECD
jgi:hypothetical protein